MHSSVSWRRRYKQLTRRRGRCWANAPASGCTVLTPHHLSSRKLQRARMQQAKNLWQAAAVGRERRGRLMLLQVAAQAAAASSQAQTAAVDVTMLVAATLPRPAAAVTCAWSRVSSLTLKASSDSSPPLRPRAVTSGLCYTVSTTDCLALSACPGPLKHCRRLLRRHRAERSGPAGSATAPSAPAPHRPLACQGLLSHPTPSLLRVQDASRQSATAGHMQQVSTKHKALADSPSECVRTNLRCRCATRPERPLQTRRGTGRP